MEMIAVKIGFWSAYYSHAKRPMPLDSVLEKIEKSYNGENITNRKHADDVDVDAFLQRETEFFTRLAETEK